MTRHSLKIILWGCALLFIAISSYANVPGGGTGTGANVTVTQNGTNVVLANGIVSFTINTTNGNITNFTYNGVNLLAGGHGGGSFYFDGSGGPTLTNPVYTLTVNPANNGGNQAEIWLQSTADPMDMAVYYDLLRGQQGIYDTMILTHQAGYADYQGAELRTNMYVGSIFDWLCVDPYRFRQMADPNSTEVAVAGAPAEVYQWTGGIYSGSTECKYAYSAPLGKLNTYGWASSSSPYGVWQTFPSHEYLDGGPMHRELTEHIGNTLLDMFGGGHYGFGSDGDQPAGTFSSKTFGPAFIYANKYAGSTSDPVSLKARVLWADAQAQAAAEQGAWPYTWFNPQPVGGSGSAYPQAVGRGTVSGTLAINDPYHSGTSPVSLWIGLAPVDGGIDFQQQYLTCQFWVQTGAGGGFAIPNVTPGTYNLWAFGPGVVGTYEKTNITVTAGQSLSLGTVTWTPLRLGPTVWDIGIPDRDSNEFHNGEHDVTPYSGILPPYAGGAPYNNPTAWAAFLDYANQYPAGVSYVVGTSSYANDWNYCQPTTLNGTGTYVGSTSKIFFNLASAPTAAQTARLYIAFASAYASACILTINGTVQTASVMGSTEGNYTAITNSANGFYPPNLSFDAIVRLGSQGAWGDAYLDFAGTKLKAGMNEIDIGLRPAGGAGNGNGFEYDYIRLELTGYATPTPTPGGNTATPTRTLTSTPTVTRTNTPTSTSTPTMSSTLTSTRTATLTATSTRTNTPTATSTATSTTTSTRTSTPTSTLTSTSTATDAHTGTFTATHTNTSTVTLSSTSSPTATATPTLTRTNTFTSTVTSTRTNTPTTTATLTMTYTATSTHTLVNTGTFTSTVSSTSTKTSTLTATPTHSPTVTGTPTSSTTGTAPATDTYTATSTSTSTETRTGTPTFSPTPTSTRTSTSTATWTNTFSTTPSYTATVTDTASATWTSSSTSTNSLTPTVTDTGTQPSTLTATLTPSSTVTSTNTSVYTDTPSWSPTNTFTPTPTLTATATDTATWTFTSTNTSVHTDTPSWTSTVTFTPTATLTATATDTATWTFTSTNTSVYTDTPSWTPTDTFTPTSTLTATVMDTATWTFTSTNTSVYTDTPSWTPTDTFTPTSTLTAAATDTVTWTYTSTNTSVPAVTPSWTPTATTTSTWTATRTFTSSTTPIWTATTTASPTASWTSTPIMGDCGVVSISKPYPNPVSSGSVKVDLKSACSKNVKWAVYSSAYRKIGEWTLSVSTARTVAWNLTDLKGKKVAAGNYYLVFSPSGQKSQTLAVIVLR